MALGEAVEIVPGAVVVAAAYADARRGAQALLPPEQSPRNGMRAGVGVCLRDTAVKDGRGLLERLSPDALASLVADAHAAGLQMALAGALRAEDLPKWSVTPGPTSPVSAPPPAATAGGREGALDAARETNARSCAATPRAGDSIS